MTVIDSKVVAAIEVDTARRTDRLSRQELVVMSALAIAALALRVFLLRHPVEMSGDQVWYSVLGQNLISGNFREGFSVYWPPLYPLLVGGFSAVIGNVELAGRLVSVVCGSLLVIVEYLFVRRLYGKNPACIAAFVTVVYPMLIEYSTLGQTESVYTLMFSLVLLAGLTAIPNGKWSRFFLIGVLIGACYLLRPEAIGFAGLMVLITVGATVTGGRISMRSGSVNALILLTGSLLISLPYILYLRAETGRWGISEKLTAGLSAGPNGKDKWRGLIDGGQTTLADKLWAGARVQEDVLESVRPDTAVASAPFDARQNMEQSFRLPSTRNVIQNLYKEYVSLSQLMTPAVIFLAGFGLFGGKSSRYRVLREMYLLAFVGATLAGYAVMGFELRYGLALLPIFICWSSRGVVELEGRLIRSEQDVRGSRSFLRRHRTLLRILILSGLALSLLPWLARVARPEIGNEKQVASWIREHTNRSPTVMASGPWVAFFAEGKHQYIPNEDYGIVIDYVRRKPVDYLVVEERNIGLTPKLNSLLNDTGEHPGLTLVYGDDTPRRKVRVFKLIDPENGMANHP